MSYERVIERVEEAAARAGRDPTGVDVVVVSKGRSVDRILEVYELGHRDFGENRAQELGEKAPALPSDIRWHFVGPLQTNKVRLVRPLVSLLHSLDRDALAPAWSKGPGSPPAALLQVNIGREPQKGGVDPAAAAESLERLAAFGIPVVGLMAIPPVPTRPEDSRPWFTALRELRDRLCEDHPAVTALSMGMSDDFEVAIEEGATSIRPGRAIFDP